MSRNKPSAASRLHSRPLLCAGLLTCLLPMLLVACSQAAPGECAADSSSLRRGKVARVVDGDTIHLVGGEKIRLIGINAPEIGRDGRPHEPYALAASKQLRSLVGASGQVGLQYGKESSDRYGRRLAHVFDAGGNNLQARLLEAGMVFHVAVAPNFGHLDCLREAEARAEETGLGVWSEPTFEARSVRSLTADSAGFTRLRGTVTRVSFKDNGWWIQLDGKVGMQIKREVQYLFERADLKALEGEALGARGWLVPMKGGWWKMNIGHPSMLESGG